MFLFAIRQSFMRWLIIAFILLMTVHVNGLAIDSCTTCHRSANVLFDDQHSHENQKCTSCHAGDASRSSQEDAHRDLIKSPGNLSNAQQSCGHCHAQQVQGVMHSSMHTGVNVVETTRQVLEPGKQFTQHSFQSLGDGIADSMLKKLCASCHLGHERNTGAPDAIFDRGGGCLACHLKLVPGNGAHPKLSRKVGDDRCFGCHSRSGRIALSYAGLAETDHLPNQQSQHAYARLADGRLLRRHTPDIHHQAGMACIDCHTGNALMGLNSENNNSTSISCEDCHANNHPRLDIDQWPEQSQSMLRHIPFPTKAGQVFLQTASGMPLAHINTSSNRLMLYPKLGGKPVQIPVAQHQDVDAFNQHAGLTCESCHTQWVPSCLGCHMTYDPAGKQWDHTLKQATSGAWHEYRWHIGIASATLGKLDKQTIDTFLPGMIMTLEHPPSGTRRFIRRFAPISAHTSGSSRSCADCHRSSATLGIGSGMLKYQAGELMFQPYGQLLEDGLSGDAWTSFGNTKPDNDYPRPFNRAEIEKIFSAPLPAD